MTNTASLSVTSPGAARTRSTSPCACDWRLSGYDAVYVAVEDPDALYARAKSAGARIEMELHTTDYGSRDFACRDPEGNLWSFGTYWPKASEKPS